MKMLTIQTTQRGLSLIELMIAMTLGILIVAGMGTLFMQNKNSYRQDEQIARMQEDARFALNEIVDDIELAGFWSNLHDPATITVDADLVVTQDCGDGTANWIYNLMQPIAAFDMPTAGGNPNAVFECVANANWQANSDIFLIKRVEGMALEEKATAPAAAAAPRVYLRTNGVIGWLHEDGDATGEPSFGAGTVENWLYLPVLYYVRSYAATAGDGIPTLCRYSMNYAQGVAGGSPSMVEECLAQGVENMQLEYGIDNNSDGVANLYLSNPTAAQLAANLVSVRVHLLLRSLVEDQNYTNAKTYSLGNLDYDPADDGFYRRVHTTTISVRNPTNLLCMQAGC